jgi:hypothetical protein
VLSRVEARRAQPGFRSECLRQGNHFSEPMRDRT